MAANIWEYMFLLNKDIWTLFKPSKYVTSSCRQVVSQGHMPLEDAYLSYGTEVNVKSSTTCNANARLISSISHAEVLSFMSTLELRLPQQNRRLLLEKQFLFISPAKDVVPCLASYVFTVLFNDYPPPPPHRYDQHMPRCQRRLLAGCEISPAVMSKSG